jgi:signal transduction histidine kinase/heme-degrading monooxygenase HmoA
MILAVSRFRVANGMEAAVREAFVRRPHMVDGVPGFLGMETFTGREDPTIFYLVTRWSDSSSFQRWHHSPGHHQSHRFIPKGLKLDSSYTQLLELDRIDAPVAPKGMECLTADSAPLLAKFLRDSTTVHLIAAGADGTILTSNAAFASGVGRAPGEVAGSLLWDYLVAADADAVRRAIARDEGAVASTTVLNFVGRNAGPYSMLCRIDVQPDGIVIVGEPPTKKAEKLQEELLELNNELATMSRENVRRKRELEKAMVKLKEAQAMLVHQEKMASLGQMTAGVAHEINNPIGFVLSNQTTLLRDFQNLLAFINVVGDSMDELGAACGAVRERLLHKAGEIDLAYLAEAIPQKIAHNLEGLERIKQIVLDLRGFSRLDESQFKLALLNDGIAATLRFLSPLLEETRVTVRTELGDLPPLYCSPAMLNQALSNIIANAVQASPPQGEVVVVSARHGDRYVLTVADRGTGIAPEHLAKVFEPFFTTKPVGSGTGLGLHIAHQVVTAHHGDITIDSRLGEGTTVTISIPFQTARAEDPRSELKDEAP